MTTSHNTLKFHLRTLDPDLEIGLKGSAKEYQIILIQSKSEKPGDSGSVWHRQIHDDTKVKALEEIIRAYQQTPSTPTKITISDGIRISVQAAIGDSQLQYEITEVETGIPEQALLRARMDLVEKALETEDHPKWALPWLEGELREANMEGFHA